MLKLPSSNHLRFTFIRRRPSQIQKTVVTPILKKPHLDSLSQYNYRPISILYDPRTHNLLPTYHIPYNQ